MRRTVLLSAPYMIPVFDQLRPLFDAAGIDVIVAPVEERLSEAELLEYAGRIDGTVCGDDLWSAKALEAAAPRLKVIAKWGTGIDSIDQAGAWLPRSSRRFGRGGLPAQRWTSSRRNLCRRKAPCARWTTCCSRLTTPIAA